MRIFESIECNYLPKEFRRKLDSNEKRLVLASHWFDDEDKRNVFVARHTIFIDSKIRKDEEA